MNERGKLQNGAVVTLVSVAKHYGAVTALTDVSFEAKPGRITGLLGANGAGKTTALRTIVGLVRPDAGQALIGERRYEELEHPLRVAGFIGEDVRFHPLRSARDALAICALSAGVEDSSIDDLLDTVGLTSAARRPVGGFSLGMRQRLGLACALIAEPCVLILDEPMTGLDPHGVRWLRELLKDRAERGCTVLVSSHMLAEMEGVIDDAVIVERGRSVIQAPLMNLLGVPAVVAAAPDVAALGRALDVAGLRYEERAGALLVHDALPENVSIACARANVPLTELRAHRRTLEDAYVAVTAGTQ